MKIVKKLLILAVIICSCQTVNALFITDLGIVEYNDYLQIDITYPGEVELEYVYSSINSSAMVFDKLSYIPATNITRYLFTSELYFPEYYERLDIEEFLFQDVNSKQLYFVSIDMTDLVVPDDPYEVELIALTEQYNNLSSDYDMILANLTSTWNELNELIDMYNTKYSQLNATLERNHIIEMLLSNQTSELNTVKNDLNLSDEQLYNMTVKATNFERFFDEATSWKSGFSFTYGGKDEEYKTFYSLNQIIEDLQGQLEGVPFLMVFFIIISVIITVMFSYKKFVKNTITAEQLEIENGTDPTTTKVNSFFSSLKILPAKMKKKKQPIADTSEINKPNPLVQTNTTFMNDTKTDNEINNKIDTEDENITIMKPVDNYMDLKAEMNDEIKRIDTKIDLNHQDIVDKLNKILQVTPTTMKNNKKSG